MLPVERTGPRSFVTAYLERTGAVLEEAGYELLEALLPEGLPYLKDQEDLLLTFDYEVAQENPEAIFVTYGSPFLDRLAELAMGYGRYTILYGPEGSFKQAGWLEQEILKEIEFRHCRPPKVIHKWLEGHTLRGFYFRAVFSSYEKTEELLEIVVDGYTGLVVPDFTAWWGRIMAAEEPSWQLPRAKSISPAKFYKAACQEAEKQAKERALIFQRQSKERLKKELTKVSGYYSQMNREIKNKLEATEEKDKRERLAKKLAAVEAERQRREKDTLERYAIEANLHLDHIVDYRLPRLHIKLELQHKKQLLETTVLYNPLAHRLEAPVCPLCGHPSKCLLPDDRENRFICPRH
ncbi:MAG TPA: hypothetical protein DCK76_11270 [Desulfotomaculum sp.]|nr:hypothetical protein [Desulfotomaculum sp.]HBY05289.1 hypothetical protein [Desulfotomaculum sp.]